MAVDGADNGRRGGDVDAGLAEDLQAQDQRRLGVDAGVELFGAYADEPTLIACTLSMQTAMLVVRMSMGLLFAREFTREAAEATRGVES